MEDVRVGGASREEGVQQGDGAMMTKISHIDYETVTQLKSKT